MRQICVDKAGSRRRCAASKKKPPPDKGEGQVKGGNDLKGLKATSLVALNCLPVKGFPCECKT